MAVQSKELVLGPWGKAVAGATGAVFANIMVYPLDMYVYSPLVAFCLSARETISEWVNIMSSFFKKKKKLSILVITVLINSVKTKLQVQTKPSSSNGKDDDLEKQKDE